MAARAGAVSSVAHRIDCWKSKRLHLFEELLELIQEAHRHMDDVLRCPHVRAKIVELDQQKRRHP